MENETVEHDPIVAPDAPCDEHLCMREWTVRVGDSLLCARHEGASTLRRCENCGITPERATEKGLAGDNGWCMIQAWPWSPSLRSLPIFSWEKASDGSMLGIGPRKEGTEYLAKVLPSRMEYAAWVATLIFNGEIVHQSEHESRNDAQLAAVAALRRAIPLREGP